ncbi:MAG: hypothetical protein ACK4M7_02705, partial [Burkholderiales bacterium]
LKVQEALIKGIPILAMVARRDIEAGEILGYNYGDGYWSMTNSTPRYFYKDGTLAPLSSYSVKQSAFPLYKKTLTDYQQGVNLYKLEKYTEAIDLLNNKVLTNFMASGKPGIVFQIATCYSTLASCYRDIGDLESAKLCVETALGIFTFYKTQVNPEKIEALENKLASIQGIQGRKVL